MKIIIFVFFITSFHVLSSMEEMETPKVFNDVPIPEDLFDNNSSTYASEFESDNVAKKTITRKYSKMPSPKDEAHHIKDFIITKLMLKTLPELIEKKLIINIEELQLTEPLKYSTLKREATSGLEYRSFFEEVFVNENSKKITQSLMRKTLIDFLETEHHSQIKNLHFQRNLLFGFSILEGFSILTTLIATIPPVLMHCDT